MNVNDWLKERTVLKTNAGSHAYGTNVEGSDRDYKGCVVAPLIYYLGFSQNFEQSESQVNKGAESDETIYEIRKFFHLCGLGNPNCLESLFVEPEDVLFVTPAGQELIDNRDLFLSKRIRYTMGGYAKAQLNRILTHKRWLLSPLTKRPERNDFGLQDDHHKLSKDDAGAIDSLIDKGHSFSGNLMELVTKEKKYRQAMKDWESYNRWKETRNHARAELEAKSGYDTKHAMHLIRLLTMCQEVLEGKGLIVKRPDAKEFVAIRNGAWTFDEVIDWAARQDQKCEELLATSKLPKSPDYKKLDELCMEIIISMENK